MSLAGVPAKLKQRVKRLRSKDRERPARIEAAGPGQESVWDYPRPPCLEAARRRVRVVFGGVVLAESANAVRVLETAGPPVYYIPPEDIQMDHLEPSARTSLCEWKGLAHYWTVCVGERLVEDAAWSYPEPWTGYEAIRDHVAFNAGAMDVCTVGGHRVQPQPGGYYGGWITPEVVGPFKGEPGSDDW